MNLRSTATSSKRSESASLLRSSRRISFTCSRLRKPFFSASLETARSWAPISPTAGRLDDRRVARQARLHLIGLALGLPQAARLQAHRGQGPAEGGQAGLERGRGRAAGDRHALPLVDEGQLAGAPAVGLEL